MNSIERAQQRLTRLSRAGVAVSTPAVMASRSAGDNGIPLQQVSLDRARVREFAGPWGDPNASSTEDASAVFRALGAAMAHRAQEQTQLGSSRQPLDSAVAVVSARRGDGRTYCAWHLAASLLQQQAQSVLLVDACGGAGSLTQRMGLPTDRGGLHALLSGQVDDWTQVVLGTDWPGLQVLPMAGGVEQVEAQPGMARWRRFLGQWVGGHHDRWVVLDTPALMPASSSIVPLQSMGQAVMVARSGQPWSEVQRVAQMLQVFPAVWGVLNQVDRLPDGVARAG